MQINLLCFQHDKDYFIVSEDAMETNEEVMPVVQETAAKIMVSLWWIYEYRQVSNIRRTLVGN